jgi:hypothetical protein
MKNNLLIIAVMAIVFFACKKDRTCSCTLTKTGTSKTQGKVEMSLGFFPVPLADTTFETKVSDIQTYDVSMKKVTKKTAKNNCFSYSEPYKEKTITSVPASSFNLSVVVTDEGINEYNCKLK